MFVLIAGGGRTGAQLARALLEQKYKVRVIEHRADIVPHLHRELPTEIIVQGNATEVEVLEFAGIRQANVLAACMPADEDNLVVCFVARQKFQVPRTIARINNPRNAWLFDDHFHVDVALNHAAVMSSLIQEEMSLGDMMTLLKLRRGEFSLVEEKVPPGARAVGLAIKDLNLTENCVISAIIRAGKMVLPRGGATLEIGDEVLAITDQAGAQQLKNLFAPDLGST